MAIYGFLDGYDNLDIMQRYAKYCNNVGAYSKNEKRDMPLIEYWSEIKKNMISKKKTYIGHLITELNKRIEKGNDNLPYINEANKLMKEPYPFPNYLSGIGYRKCEIDGKVFFVPLSDKEFRAQANIPILSDNNTSDKMASALSKIGDIKGNTITLPDDNTEKVTDNAYNADTLTSDTSDEQLPKTICSNEKGVTQSGIDLSQKEKQRKGVIFLIGAVCILTITIFYLLNFTNKKGISEQEPSLKHSITSSTENIEENSTQEQSSSSIYDSYEPSPYATINCPDGTSIYINQPSIISKSLDGTITIIGLDDNGNPLEIKKNISHDSNAGNVKDNP